MKRDKNASIIYRGEDNSYYEKMLATGKVKCIDEEIPFEVPNGWEWCRLRDIILGTNAGKSPNCEKRPKKSEEWGVLTTTSIQENAFLSNENKVLPKHYVITPEHCVRYGDILITRAGPVNRTGIVCMVENNCDKLILSDKTVRIDYMHDYCNPKFLVFVLNSSAIHELVMSATVGMAASQVNVSQGSIQNTLIPFPPSKEQQRIINKLEALLPQIEKYNNAQNKLDELNKTVKDIIKKSVLQEAIQGKLVSQLEEEGTAKELLGQIKAEKQRLVKDGKLKKSALNDSVIFKGDDNKYYELIGSEVSEIELPFGIPNSWSLARLNAVCQLTDGLKATGKQCLLDAKYLRGKSSGTIVEQGKLVYKGDNIVLVDGENSGEVFIVPQDGYMGSTFKQLWISSSMYEPYVLAFIQFYKETLRNSKKGAAIPHLNKELFYGLIIGIPSLQEQRRIVQKIGQLMQLLK
ncbi:restriction endonuclease subunit S [Segatella copri]|uniref:Restriction endonuclease subunit S n=1 Tax=Segatella copri TaxID=165179 RepID=A0AA92WE07_9BACT|nr:restriction endonuclease subunit S [Segatella copri]